MMNKEIADFKRNGTSTVFTEFTVAGRYDYFNEDIFRQKLYIKNNKKQVKAFLIRMLALDEMLQGVNAFIKNDLSITFYDTLHLFDPETMEGSFVVVNENLTKPYIKSDFGNNKEKFMAVVYPEYLRSAPEYIAEIIREIELDRENLIKKCIFEMKLAGFDIKTIHDAKRADYIKFIEEGIDDNE